MFQLFLLLTLIVVIVYKYNIHIKHVFFIYIKSRKTLTSWENIEGE